MYIVHITAMRVVLIGSQLFAISCHYDCLLFIILFDYIIYFTLITRIIYYIIIIMILL